MIWRLDLKLIDIATRYGPLWALVTVVCLLYVMFSRLDRALLLMLAVVIGGMTWHGPLVHMAFTLRWWLLGVLAVRGLGAVSSMSADRRQGGRPPVSIVAFGTMLAASAAWSASPELTAALAASLICVFVLAFVVLWRLIDSRILFPALCSGTVIMALLVQGLGLVFAAYARITDDPFLVRMTGTYGRLSGVLWNANGNGVFGAVFLPILLAAPGEYLGRMRRLRWVAVFVVVVCVIFSASRTALGISVMGTALIVLYRYRFVGAFAMCSVLVVGAVTLMASPAEELEGSVEGRILRTDTLYDIGGRLELWERGWDVAMESPVIGHGWGSSRTLGNQDAQAAIARGLIAHASNLHSSHIVILVDLGFLGLGIFWWFGASTVFAGMRVLRAPPTPENRVTSLIFLSVLGLLADTFVHAGVLAAGSSNSLLFWSASALVLRRSRQLAAERSAPAPPPPQPAGASRLTLSPR